MKQENKFIKSLLLIAIGALFAIKKGGTVSIALTVVGAFLVIAGIVDITKDMKSRGIVKIVAGAAVILFGWLFVDVTLIVLAVLMILSNLGNLITAGKSLSSDAGTASKIVAYGRPVFGLAAGIILLFNRSGTVDWVFTIAGIVLIVEGVMTLLERSNKAN